NDDRLEWKTFGDGAKPRPFVDSMKRALAPVLSPDGRLAAFTSGDSGTPEIWAARFPGGEGLVQVSRGGGMEPVWSPDGRFLYFEKGDSVYRASVTGGAHVDFGTPERVLDGKPEQLAVDHGFDVLPGGSEFVMVQQLPFKDAALIYVQDWFAEFRKRP
ncbi:MAG TPA: hypothetical protein VNI57_15540, partial [Candidatus Saccharimonadales bacterium]|nr:hypothetical protein [Candidatus Saccharimonadales bacterium]